MIRDAFLARVRAALAAGGGDQAGRVRKGSGPGPHAAAQPTPRGADGLPRADHPGHDPEAWPERFGRELEAVGGTWARVAADEAALAHHLESYARGQGLRQAVAWDPEALPAPEGAWLRAALTGLERAGCRAQVLAAGGTDVADPASARAAAAAAEVGVVVAEAGVVASGSVLLVHRPGRSRVVSLLPEHLLVLVPEGRLRPTLAEVLAELAGAARAGVPWQNATLVTGPSKSADIELELVTGVHGPRWVHAVVVAGGGDGAR